MGRTETEKNTILSTVFPECNPACISEMQLNSDEGSTVISVN